MNTKPTFKFLVAQDMQIIFDLLKMRMEDRGLPCVLDHVLNGELAVGRIKEGKKYDAILMNIEMPLLDGTQATQEIRKIDKEIPIIGWSMHPKESVWSICEEAGMNDYVEEWNRDIVDDILIKLAKQGVVIEV